MATMDMIRRFVADYPHAFNIAAPKPLRKDIVKDLFEVYPDLPRRQVRQGLVAYCRSDIYLRATVAGAIRVNLRGYTAGIVEDKEAAWAADLLDQRRARRAAAVLRKVVDRAV